MLALSNEPYGQVKNDPDLYPLTLKANKANRDAIMTWEGVVEVETNHAGFAATAPYFYTTKSQIRFYYDRKSVSLLFNEKTTYYLNGMTGEKFKDAELYKVANGMRTANGYYEYPSPPGLGRPPEIGARQELRMTGRVLPILTIGKNQAEDSHESGRHFDPFRFFGFYSSDDFISPFSLLQEHANNDENITIHRTGDIVTL